MPLKWWNIASNQASLYWIIRNFPLVKLTRISSQKWITRIFLQGVKQGDITESLSAKRETWTSFYAKRVPILSRAKNISRTEKKRNKGTEKRKIINESSHRLLLRDRKPLERQSPCGDGTTWRGASGGVTAPCVGPTWKWASLALSTHSRCAVASNRIRRRGGGSPAVARDRSRRGGTINSVKHRK